MTPKLIENKSADVFIICPSVVVVLHSKPHTDYSEHIRQAQSTASAGSSPVHSICLPLPGLRKKYDEKATWGGRKENPFIIPGVCGVGEINRGVHAEFIYILLCEPNTLTWGKEDEWVV